MVNPTLIAAGTPAKLPTVLTGKFCVIVPTIRRLGVGWQDDKMDVTLNTSMLRTLLKFRRPGAVGAVADGDVENSVIVIVFDVALYAKF